MAGWYGRGVKAVRLGSSREFGEALARHLARFADARWPLPSEEELLRLVEVVFFSSLHEEETRRVEFNVAWQPSATDCTTVVEIATTVPATPKNLSRLAPATQREATSIAVRRDGDELVAWALLQRSSAPGSPLTLWTLSPGVLRVDYAGVPRALYARGEIVLLSGAHEVKSPARRLTQAFPAWAAEADPSTRIDPRATVVTRLAARALEHGHGGMILLVPAEVKRPLGVRMHYEVGRGNDVLAKRYAAVTRGVEVGRRFERLRASRARAIDGRIPLRDEAQLAYAEAVELVARLTAIDNAVLLDTDLCLRGFGVQVIEGDARRITFEHVSPYSDEVHVDDLSTFKGTRHPAGVMFCMRQEREAAAVIASQAGRLSLAVKDPDGVVEVLGSFERSFGWR